MRLNENNDHTALLLCNMLENVKEDPKDIMYVPLA